MTTTVSSRVTASVIGIAAVSTSTIPRVVIGGTSGGAGGGIRQRCTFIAAVQKKSVSAHRVVISGSSECRV
jgi:hypothetical protein